MTDTSHLPKSVMLVDDDRITNFISKRIVEDVMPEAILHVFLSPVEALQFITDDPQHRPELILLDINMPEMSGFEFIRAFQALNFSAKIFVLSSSVESEEINEILAFPEVYGYICKPLTRDLFHQKIIEVLTK